MGYLVHDGETVVNVWNTVTGEQKTVISKSLTDLSREEMVKRAIEIVEAKKTELVSLYELGCFKRYPRRRAHNVVDTRW
eukprot:1028977-Pyramimonas_sp.AAC.1